MISEFEKKHRYNMVLLSRKIRRLYEQAAKEAALMGTSIQVFNPDKPFSFADYPATIKKIDKLLNELNHNVTETISTGIKVEWHLADDKNNAFADEFFGGMSLTDEQKKLYYRNNDKALDAFLNRKDNGLNLSDRVWKYNGQFKEEIEMALDVGIGDGVSAADMARDLKKYLQNPDMLFRRVRDKRGNLQLSKNAKAYHPGQGVYRSSYKNALRLARTETNIAYRTSDYVRYQQLDFVVGIEIKLSNNHPVSDICDFLAGQYPKDFIFTGWHPQCRCHVNSILKTPEEFIKKEKSKNEVNDVPENFRKWCDDNKTRLESAKNLPYFVRDNSKYFQGIKFSETASESILNSQNLGKVIKPSPLDIAAQRHASRTPEYVQGIKHEWNERKATRHYGQNIASYMDGISDVDTSSLKKMLKGGDIKAILNESNRLKKIGKEILGYKYLDNPMSVARKYSMADAKTVNNAVKTKLESMSSDFVTRKAKLEFEIDWVERNKKYSTWKVAQDAYKKELKAVEFQIKLFDITNDVSDAIAFASRTKSKKYHILVDEFKRLSSVKNPNMAKLKSKAISLKTLYNKELSKQSSKLSKYKSKSIKGETLSELKQRLGKDFPKTLECLDNAIAKYETTYKYGNNAKQYKAEIENIMREIFDKHDFGMNVKEKLLESILNSYFKNTFETGSSGGYLGSSKITGLIESTHDRLMAANKLFGLSGKKQLQRSEYEKYGNLLDRDKLKSMKNSAASQYGNVEVRFKKDKVTCTWTAGDSLGERYQPSLCSDPKSASFDNIYNTPNSAVQTDDFVKFRNDHINRYLELQYHGKLTVDCVESLTFPYDLHDPLRANMLDVARQWKSRGVDIFYIVNDKLYQL